jgi:hypothetical protein
MTHCFIQINKYTKSIVKQLMTHCIAIFTYKTVAHRSCLIYMKICWKLWWLSTLFRKNIWHNFFYLKASSTNKTTNNILYNNLYINKGFQGYHNTKSFI